MSKQTTYLLGILITIIVGSVLYSTLCCKECCSPNAIKVTPLITKENKGISNPFSFANDGFRYSYEKNFNFNFEKFNHNNVPDKNIDRGIIELKSYFSKNPDGRLTITGYCLAEEKNNSAFPNLGFARANDVKNYFISKGIPSSKFQINGEVSANLLKNNNSLEGPITYQLTNDILKAKGEDWNDLKEKLNDNPLVLHFNTNQTEINLNKAERDQITQLTHYLDNVPSGKINCVGHTDNTGDRTVNIQLGQERANFVKDYLIKNGISSDKIEASSKGPDEPIADNLTPEGKAKNRRTVITIK
jgi:OmpA-OmpF porin, OOP family